MLKYIIIIAVVFNFTACFKSEKGDIQIGFVAGLSGKYSSLGTSIRDGFILAFDEIDNTINGKNIKIIQKDDKQDAKEAKKIIDNFVKNNIKLIVGNATSSMTAVSFPVINKQKDSLLFSVTASSSEFSNKDDNFLRLQVEQSEKRYIELAKYIKKYKYHKVFFIYDGNNKSYAKGYEGFFQNMIIKNGGIKFVASMDLNEPYGKIVNKIKDIQNDLILIVGNSIDSANIIQYLRINEIKSKILISGWSKTLDFIENGGKSVEGVVVSTGYDEQSKDKKFLSFVKNFKIKYGKEPSVFAAQGYELGQILIKSLKQSDDISTLKDRIIKTKTFDGLQGDIVFDKYGDVYRDYFVMEVKNAEFIKVK